MKKIISCLCLSIFICISILKPINVFAYNDLDTYVSADLTTEEFHDSVIGSIIAGLLESGGSIYIPAGLTTDEFYEDIADTLYEVSEKDIWDSAWDYYMKYPSLTFDSMPYYMWSDTPSYGNSETPGFIQMGLDIISDLWDNENVDIPTFPPDYTFLNYANDFVLSYNNGGTTTYIEDNVPVVFKYEINSPLTYDRTSVTYVLNQNSASFFGTTNLFLLSNYVTFYVTLDNGSYIVTHTNYSVPNVTIPGRNGNVKSLSGFYSQNEKSVFSDWNTSLTWYNPFPKSYSTLNDALVEICRYNRNFDLYVDGVPWIVKDLPGPIQLGGSTFINNTSTQVDYKFPDDTYFSPNFLKSILRQLIDANNTGNGIYIKLDDILDAFVDHNGQTVVYTLNVVRNDYDNLIFEQYGNNRLTQNKGLLFPSTELQPYTETSAYITNSSINLIPNDILVVLSGCGVLILIAYLINRLLE